MEPIDPDHCDPYTRCRVITMNGIEIEAILFGHQFARHCPDLEVKRQLARTRYIEAQQQKAVNWLLPGVSSVLETTIAYKQVAVDRSADTANPAAMARAIKAAAATAPTRPHPGVESGAANAAASQLGLAAVDLVDGAGDEGGLL
ncbi:hypothetical protein OG310_29690 [Streptomyces sp. NBC_01497]